MADGLPQVRDDSRRSANLCNGLFATESYPVQRRIPVPAFLPAACISTVPPLPSILPILADDLGQVDTSEPWVPTLRIRDPTTAEHTPWSGLRGRDMRFTDAYAPRALLSLPVLQTHPKAQAWHFARILHVAGRRSTWHLTPSTPLKPDLMRYSATMPNSPSRTLWYLKCAGFTAVAPGESTGISRDAIGS